MVNTFVSAFPYNESAKQLDKKRLFKQIVEALQILNLVNSFHVLGDMFQNPCPKNPYMVKAWIKEIMQKYKALDYYVFLHQNEYAWYSKSSPKPKKLKYDESYQILSDGQILYNNQIYPKYGLILPGDNFMTMGFYSHPIVLAWINHSDSLKLYINCHLDEFLSRGGKPGTEKLRCSIKVKEIEHPEWAMEPEFHANHKAALLTKEIARKETPWYYNFRDFKEAYNLYVVKPPSSNKSTSDFDHYIWPYAHENI